MDRLEAGARQLGLSLGHKALEQFYIYYRELIAWNRKVNLTAITDYKEVQVKHFLDSITVATAMNSALESPRLIDIGTGAGFPGLPLKILLPDIKLTLLDSTAKKARFLEDIVQKLGLEGIDIVVGRAEEVGHFLQRREKYNLAVSRAVAALPALVELALPFCAVGGSFIAHKKGDIEEEVARSEKAIEVLGGRLREVRALDLPQLDDQRFLVIIDKAQPTPQKYPLHPGVPARRPVV